MEEGDVSRLIAASSLGSMVAAGGVGITVLIGGVGNPLLASVAVFGTHAAAQLMLVPLFLDTPSFAAYAPRRERLVQLLLTLGVTLLVFGFTAAPPLVFAVMPMFAWLAFRGTLREASLLLTGVGTIATVMTALQLGPVHGLGARYDVAPELVVGYLQLFLLDCALILLPLSVMTTQQRMAAARARSGQHTLQRLIDAATGSGVLAVEPDGRVVVFNPGAETMLGRPRTRRSARSPTCSSPTPSSAATPRGSAPGRCSRTSAPPPSSCRRSARSGTSTAPTARAGRCRWWSPRCRTTWARARASSASPTT